MRNHSVQTGIEQLIWLSPPDHTDQPLCQPESYGICVVVESWQIIMFNLTTCLRWGATKVCMVSLSNL